MKIFDYDQALAIAGDDPDLLAELLTLFEVNRGDMIAALKGAATAADLIAVGKAAHSLKGSLANLGAQKASAIAKELETPNSDQRLDNQVDRLVAAVEEFMQTWRSRVGGTAPVKSPAPIAVVSTEGTNNP